MMMRRSLKRRGVTGEIINFHTHTQEKNHNNALCAKNGFDELPLSESTCNFIIEFHTGARTQVSLKRTKKVLRRSKRLTGESICTITLETNHNNALSANIIST